MPFQLRFTAESRSDLSRLSKNPALLKRLKSVQKALAYLESNPRHPGLQTHKYSAITGNYGEEVFEAYAENRAPAAYRIFWHYGPGKNTITIVTITSHP